MATKKEVMAALKEVAPEEKAKVLSGSFRALKSTTIGAELIPKGKVVSHIRFDTWPSPLVWAHIPENVIVEEPRTANSAESKYVEREDMGF